MEVKEPTAEDLLRAEQYWAEQRTRVELIAKELGHPEKPCEAFLFDLFDDGDAELTDDELRAELEEYFDRGNQL